MLEATVGGARVWCTGRALGNVGDHVGDASDVVAANREALARSVGVAREHFVWVRQVHGTRVHRARGPGPVPAPEADAVVTAERGLAVAVVTADCAPLVLASDGAVAVVHAGHRGLALGVVEEAVAELRGIGVGDVHAFLGPCIRAEDYEFGADDLAPFVERFGPEVAARTSTGRPALDIPAAIRVVLDRSGVASFDDCGVSTAASSAYFSYRRDTQTGRQATVALLP
jgi:purine-nucleoside/S-methyl-5'-thioadenosine phosphorylase / adenosine deaminase